MLEDPQADSPLDPNTRMDSHQVAALLNVAYYTVREWRRKKMGPAYTKIGGRIWYTPKNIQDYLDSQTVKR